MVLVYGYFNIFQILTKNQLNNKLVLAFQVSSTKSVCVHLTLQPPTVLPPVPTLIRILSKMDKRTTLVNLDC